MYKTKNCLYFLLISLAFSCSEKGINNLKQHSYTNPLVADTITYEFINAVLSQDFKGYNFPCKNVLDKDLNPNTLGEIDSIRLLSMDSLFTKADVEFIYQQTLWCDSFKLNPLLVKRRKIVSLDSILVDVKAKGNGIVKAFKQKYGNEGFCHLTMPLFTLNKSIAIVKKGMICGNNCGEEETLIYQKYRKDWKLIYTLVHTPEF